MLETLISNVDQRREPRFRVTEQQPSTPGNVADGESVNTDLSILKIEIFRRVDGDVYLGTGRLIDISRNGARLMLSTEMPVGHAIGIRMQIEDANLDYITAGVVCWNACTGPDSWMVGVTLAAEFPDDIFLTFVTLDLIDRRQGDRSDATIRVRIEGAADDTEPLDVQMLNYSSEGCCILSPHPLAEDADVGLEIEVDGNTTRVRTGVQWCNECVIGHVVGFKFIDPGAGELVKAALVTENSKKKKRDQDEPPELKGIISPWMWAGIAAVIGVGVFILW